MAPEFPPRLLVFTLNKLGESISSQIESVEVDPNVNTPIPFSSRRLRVWWSEFELPPGFRPVGSGALYVEDSAGVLFDGPRPVQLHLLENNRYRWIQGTPPETPWIMIAVILPVGHTLDRPRPAPTSAKNFKGRVAVYWCLKGESDGRVSVDWALQGQVRNTDDEVRFLNSHSSLEEVPSAAGIEIDALPTLKASRSPTVFLCHSSQDKPAVRDLYAKLKEDGFTPWLDEKDILPGEEWETAITHAVQSSHVVLACLSNGSVSKAGFLQRELKFALQVAEEKPEGAIFMIPLRLEDCPVPERLSRWQWLNYFEVGSYGRLLSALHKRASQLSASSIVAPPNPRSAAALPEFTMIRLFSRNQLHDRESWNEIRDGVFQRNYEVAADPVFDIMLENRTSNTLVFYRVGIHILRRMEGKGGTMGYAQPVEVQSEFKVHFPQDWKQIWGVIDDRRSTDFMTPIEMKKGDSPYRFTLMLENFCDPYNASSCEVRFYLATGNGMAESKSIWLSQ